MKINIRKIAYFIFITSLSFLFFPSSILASETEEYPVDKWVYAEPLANPSAGKIWMYYNKDGEPEERFYTENGKTWMSDPYFGYQKGWWSENWSDGPIYYFRLDSGTMVVGWQYIDEAWRYFREDGTSVQKDWAWVKNNDGSYAWKYFYYGQSIEQFYKQGNGVWLSTKGPGTGYYKGWWTDPENGQKYFFRRTSGSRVEGWQYIDGAWRYFRLGSGTLATGFQYIDGNWYYLRENTGTRAEGWQYIDNKWYYFRKGSGTRVTGRQYIDGKWYNFSYEGINYLRTPNVSSQTGIVLSQYPYDTKVIRVKAKIDSNSVRNQSIELIKIVRAEMYDKNVPLFGRTLREVAKEAGYNTKEEYVNSINWDTSLERIAIQRAVETAYHKNIAHMRATGEDIFSAVDIEGKIYGFAENLAWYPDYESAFYGWTYGELQALIDANGETNSQNGHLVTIINPSYTVFGAAEVIGGQQFGGVQSLAASSQKIIQGQGAFGWKGIFDFEIAVPK
ncbi:CAP domain-containing protein [Peptoniphilaceae bacterium SGI.131]